MRSFQTARHPLLSLLQSAAAALERQPASAGRSTLRRDVDSLVQGQPSPTAAYAGPSASPAAATDCAGLGLELLHALVQGNHAAASELTDRIRFSACDPGWAEAITGYVARFLPGGTAKPVPYRRWRDLGDFVLSAPSASLRIGLMSDWGTGTQEARAVAALLAQQRPDVVIHLGDIYYAGMPEECDAHFFAPLRAAMPDTRLFSLCGNHDVYSGGQGYYGLLDRIAQPASYFCLRAPDQSWQILAADTGLNDRDPFDETAALTHIDPAELEWHADKLRGFPGRTILLSHHQPFSAFAEIGPLASHDPTNPHLMAAHATLAAAGRIDAWFWGHEHSLRIYAPYRGVLRGRNIGYGAIPLAVSAGTITPLAGLQNPPALATDIRLDEVDGAYTHGFALLDLSPGQIGASYWALTRPHGPIYHETIGPADPLVA